MVLIWKFSIALLVLLYNIILCVFLQTESECFLLLGFIQFSLCFPIYLSCVLTTWTGNGSLHPRQISELEFPCCPVPMLLLLAFPLTFSFAIQLLPTNLSSELDFPLLGQTQPHKTVYFNFCSALRSAHHHSLHSTLCTHELQLALCY